MSEERLSALREEAGLSVTPDVQLASDTDPNVTAVSDAARCDAECSLSDLEDGEILEQPSDSCRKRPAPTEPDHNSKRTCVQQLDRRQIDGVDSSDDNTKTQPAEVSVRTCAASQNDILQSTSSSYSSLSHASPELSEELDELSNNEQVSKEPVECSNKKVELSNEQVELSKEQVELSNEQVELSKDPVELSKVPTGLPSDCSDLRADWQFNDFQIIDDISENDEEELSADDDSLNEDDIDAMLDKAMKDRPNGDPPNSDDPIEKEKVVLIEKGVDPFDILPEGWVIVTHNSGMPLYLHKEGRVCTLSKPYFLGPGSARKHDIPVSAIPCLHYRRACAKEDKGNTSGQNDEDQKVSTPDTTLPENGVKMPSVEVRCIEEHKQRDCMEPLELRTYCTPLFKFKSITVKRFKTWKDRRKHNSKQRVGRPLLPSDTKLITCPLSQVNESDKTTPIRKKAFVLNPAGKSDVCILHEYVQHAMRLQPRYVFKELDEVSAPYSATVIINELEYGIGYAGSKKAAKAEAAKTTLGILIPEMYKVKPDEATSTQDVSFFNDVKIEDSRVSELCTKACQPSPFQVLSSCLKRNYGLGDTQLHMEMKMTKHQKSEFLMRVGKHEAMVICKNKRDGKQQAAQAILQKLHPHVQSWGSLLRLYGTKFVKERKAEQNFSTLPNEEKVQKPNYQILSQLKADMRKLHDQRVAMKATVLGSLERPSTHSVHYTDPASLNL